MPYAEVDGQRLHFEDTGGDGPVVVWSHGLYMDHEMFDPQLEALRGSWRCITWDERAHGGTESTADDFTYWDSAADLLGLLDHLGVQSAVLAGMSQGGYLSLRAALTAPDRVRALVLIDTQSGVEDPANLAAYHQLLEAWLGPDGPPQDVLDLVAAIILGSDWDGAAAWQDKWRELPSDRVQQAFRTLTTREDDVTGRLGELTMPAIVIHGEQDAAIALPHAQALADGLGAELAVVPGAGHASNLTHPAEANAAITRFLHALS
ncbi:MAG: alpha/beta hydrolase [Nocardioidaceae bacterium]|nr:alpha/beta hydrolase [Nocardioidaceae bacterium]